MKYFCFIILLFIGFRSNAQLQITPLIKEPFTGEPSSKYHSIDRMVKLNGKYYFTSVNKGFKLYESDGTARGTKIIANNSDGFFGLTATKSKIVFYEYRGALCAYKPGEEIKKIQPPFSFNAFSEDRTKERVSTIHTDEQREDMIITHMENETYMAVRVEDNLQFGKVLKANFEDAGFLQQVYFSIWDKVVLTDTAFYTTGYDRNENNKFDRALRGFIYPLTEVERSFNINGARLKPTNNVLAGPVFTLNNKVASIMFKRVNDSLQLGYGLLDQKMIFKPVFFKIMLPNDGNISVNLIQGLPFITATNFTGVIWPSKDKGIMLTTLNDGMEPLNKISRDQKVIGTTDYLFFQQADSFYYQPNYKFENYVFATPLVEKTQRYFKDNQFAYFSGATTYKYFYFIDSNKKLWRFDPITEKKTEIILPPKTEVIEWRQMHACKDALLVALTTKATKKTQNYEYYLIKDDAK